MKWQSKPVDVDAHQFDGDPVALQQWITSISGVASHEHTSIPMQFWEGEAEVTGNNGRVLRAATDPWLVVYTDTREVTAYIRDFLIRDADGVFSVMKPQDFLNTYYPIDDDGTVLSKEYLDEAAYNRGEYTLPEPHFPTQMDANSA